MIHARARAHPSPRLRLVPGGERAPEFVGTSAPVRELLAAADRLAPSDLSVLLVGESGTGKEVLARRLHLRSRRAAGPFVAENCAAIPEELVESELFGHARGAFTGAEHARDGLLSRADGGTLLLDEVGDMPLSLQAKLLRALEQGEVRPVGSTDVRRVDVRIVCATNRDLGALVREGRFRQDLWFRLCGAVLRLPPLRERPGDVAVLARHFAAGLDRAHGRTKHLAPELLQRLSAHSWPGNVRELRHRVALVYHLAEGDVVLADDFDLASGAASGHDEPEGVVRELVPMAHIERDAIRLALRVHGGDRAAAARALGISRSSIYDKIRRHGLA